MYAVFSRFSLRLPLMLVLQNVSWISAYDAAGAITDMLDANKGVLHLVHPLPAPWNTLASTFADLLEIPLVSYDEWLKALERRVVDVESSPLEVEMAYLHNPALRLIDFFRSVSANVSSEDLEPLGIAKLSSENAQSSSLALRLAHCMGKSDVRLWLSFWRRSQFIGV